jgi:OmpA-OmpF porin, OOP family
MRIKRALAGFVGGLMVVGTAYAQSSPGVYIGAGGGVNFHERSNIRGSGVNQTASYKLGWAAMGAIGYAFGGGPRAELEVSYRDNKANALGAGAGPGLAGTRPDMRTIGVMGNFVYDFLNPTGFTPYVGAGLGSGFVRVGGGSGSQTRFAYQFLAGGAYEVIPDMTMFLDYRYFGTSKVRRDVPGVGTVEMTNRNHTVMAGLRYQIYRTEPRPQQVAYTPPPVPEPPPPPPPPPRFERPAPATAPSLAERPVPQVPRSYLVFFGFDRTEITSEAAEILRTAAQNFQRTGVARIDVTGHTDRAGPASYNMGLSQRRAEAVRRQLVRLGIPENQIVVRWKGETEPLVPTPDGVAHPENRRAEIVLGS